MRASFSKKDLARYTLEAALIVFSVLLALFLDQSLSERSEARAVDELVGHVADEMRSNLAIVDEWLPYHREVIAAIDKHLASDELQQQLVSGGSIQYMRLAEKGILQDFYSVSSWQLAQQSQITSRLAFDLTHAVSVAYQSQKNVDKTLQRIVDFFFSREALDPAQLGSSLVILRHLMSEIAGQETALQQNYRRALEKINEDS